MARTTEPNYNWDIQSTLKYVRTQRNNKIYYLHVSREKPLHCSSIFSMRENDISMKIMSVYVNKWRWQKRTNTYFANNQRLWIKFSYDSHKIKDWFRSVRIQQKQPSRGVLRKRCSENLQQVYRRIPMSKYNFNKVAKTCFVYLFIIIDFVLFYLHMLPFINLN